MGKKRHRKSDISTPRTKKLDLDGIRVLKCSDDDHYYAVHERYFSKEKLPCPACGSQRTRCSKLVRRVFKDILWEPPPATKEEKRKFKIIDLVFYQRYIRCDNCGSNVFPEPISFADKGCRYTLRLSDALAVGTFEYSYKKVCNHYTVPASTASIGPIMRRQIQARASLLAPIAPLQEIGIFEVQFHRDRYAVVFALRSGDVYCIDILEDSSEERLLPYLRELDTNNIDTVYIDPLDSIRNVVASVIPNAAIVVADECLLRYARDAMLKISATDGKRFPLRNRHKYLTMQKNHIEGTYAPEKLKEGLSSRPKLRAAYEHYQDLLNLMSAQWNYNDLSVWAQGTSSDTECFSVLTDAIELFEPEITNMVTIKKAMPDTYQTSIKAICEAFAAMPHCIFDVLRGRCFFSIPHDSIEENEKKYRLGILASRMVENMNKITRNIKEEREYGLE